MKNWTGERLETFVDLPTTIEHLHRYGFALEYVKNKKVIDIACGEGYGSNILADTALEIIGVDISAETIELAKAKYQKQNLTFLSGSILDIPCQENCFDVAISFETLEHIRQHDEMIQELKRVLKPDGILIISTPDKFFYTDQSGLKNIHHVKELYKSEFKNLMETHFRYCYYFYQKPTFASLIIPEQPILGFKEYTGNFDGIFSNGKFDQLYIIAIASQSNIPIYEVASAFTDADLMERQQISTISKIKSTMSYRIGNFLLYPLKLLKMILR